VQKSARVRDAALQHREGVVMAGPLAYHAAGARAVPQSGIGA
jgi:hypothetical protein